MKKKIKRKIYLDTSIFIAEFDKKDPKHKILTAFFDYMGKIEEVDFCYSKWCLTEMIDVLSKKKIEELKIFKYINKLLDTNKLRKFRIKLLEVSPNKNYDFNDFFSDIKRDLVKYKTSRTKAGLGDVIHIRIMKNNRMKLILTFDSDFEDMSGIVTINLMNFKIKSKREK